VDISDPEVDVWIDAQERVRRMQVSLGSAVSGVEDSAATTDMTIDYVRTRGQNRKGIRFRRRNLLPAQQKTPLRGGGALLGLLQGGEICISIYVDPWEVGEPS
jgi:hypothetical protein